MTKRAWRSWNDFILQDFALAATAFAEAMSETDRTHRAP